VTTVPTTPERWARFLDEHSPGLAWLASTLVEWGELPPFARRAWRVTASTTRAGEVSGIAALHDESGLLALASLPDSPPPFLGEPERVKRIVGSPAAMEAAFSGVPMLAVRRLPGTPRQVHVYEGVVPPRHPLLRRANPEEDQALEDFRAEAGVDHDPAIAIDLAGPIQRGHVYVLEGDEGVHGMFRVEGVSGRWVQFADVCIHPRTRGRGLGSALVRATAHVARSEFARGAALAVIPSEAATRTALRAGFSRVGDLDDVTLA
jgi:GNAT superfamily N-acetyltransferase